jgi:hypothetical protein
MSIDGNFIRKKETREGPFVEENIEALRNTVIYLFNQLSTIFKQVEYYFNLDSKDVAIPDNSLEVQQLDIYSDSYRHYCNFDLKDVDSMKYSIEGFKRLINEVTPILESIKFKVNLFYSTVPEESIKKSK